MRHEFRTVAGSKVDLVTHSVEQVTKNPELTIHVGTDSINIKGETIFAVVIAFRYPNKGVHLVYRKIRVPRMRDKWHRLYREAEFSVEAANWINVNTPYKVNCIDLDYNDDPKYFSNSVVSAGAGLVLGHNFNYTIKPQEQVAARAADNFLQ